MGKGHLDIDMAKEYSKKPDISIVILCYKAGKLVIPFVNDFKKVLKANEISDYEIILVGNYQQGIYDETPIIVSQIASSDPNIVYVAKLKEGMMGWDMKTGFNLARGQYIAVIDGDGQIPIIDIVRVYKKIKEGDYDLVKTYRVKRNDEAWRKLISIAYNIIFQSLFPGTSVRDVNSKPKIFTRHAYERLNLKSDDWFIDAEIIIKARNLNFKIGEVETSFSALSSVRKSFIGVSAIIEFIINLIKYKYKELFK